MISYFCLFALFLPYCFSFPLDHYSQFHRTQQQSACQSLVLDTKKCYKHKRIYAVKCNKYMV